MKVLPCSNNRTDANKQIIDEEFQGFADDTYFYFFNGNVNKVGLVLLSILNSFIQNYIYTALFIKCCNKLFVKFLK